MEYCENIDIFDIIIPQGQTTSLLFEFGDENDNPISLEGSTLVFQVKDTHRSTETLLSASSDDVTGSKITIADQVANTGEATLTIDGSDTILMKAGSTEVQDLLVIGSSGESTYWFKGKFVLDATVSRG